jgi:hypothetical protein
MPKYRWGLYLIEICIIQDLMYILYSSKSKCHIESPFISSHVQFFWSRSWEYSKYSVHHIPSRSTKYDYISRMQNDFYFLVFRFHLIKLVVFKCNHYHEITIISNRNRYYWSGFLFLFFFRKSRNSIRMPAKF